MHENATAGQEVLHKIKTKALGGFKSTCSNASDTFGRWLG